MLFAYIFPSRNFLGTLHAKTLSNVVLPAPEAPMIAVTYPALKCPETSSSSFFFTYCFLQGNEKPTYLSSTSTEYEMFLKDISTGLYLLGDYMGLIFEIEFIFSIICFTIIIFMINYSFMQK